MTDYRTNAEADETLFQQSATRWLAKLEGVSKTYVSGLWPRRRVTALRGVSLRVAPGEIVGLVGPNRAGKTTLVKILLGLCRADAGKVRRLGAPLTDRTTLAQIGYVHEALAFPGYLSPRELLRYYGAMSLTPSSTRDARIERLLDELGLADRADEPLARFSKGMKQRLALAQALLNEPRLLVLDEPAEGMDLLARRLTRRVLADRRAAGHGALLISHSLTEIAQVCDRVVVLQAGEVVFDGTLGELAGRDAEPASIEDALQPLYAEVGA